MHPGHFVALAGLLAADTLSVNIGEAILNAGP